MPSERVKRSVRAGKSITIDLSCPEAGAISKGREGSRSEIQTIHVMNIVRHHASVLARYAHHQLPVGVRTKRLGHRAQVITGIHVIAEGPRLVLIGEADLERGAGGGDKGRDGRTATRRGFLVDWYGTVDIRDSSQ